MSDPGLQDVQQNIRVPIVNLSDSRQAGASVGAASDQMFLNCYPMVARHAITGETDFSVNKRVGVETVGQNVASLVGGAGVLVTPLANLGMTQLNDVCVGAWFEATTNTIKIIQYRPTANTTTLLGTIAGASVNDLIYFTEIMLTTSYTPGIGVIWCKFDYTNSKGYFAQSAAGVFAAASLTQITDAAFPPNLGTPDVLVGPMQQLNNFFYVMARSGKIYQSMNVLNVTAWGSRIRDTYSYPDKGVGIFRFKHHLVAFSDTTIEFFDDGGGQQDGAIVTPNLERTEQAFIKFGAISAKYIKNIDDILYWISASDTTTLGVWKMDGYTPVKISTKREETLIANALTNNANNGIITGSIESLSMLGQKTIVINNIQVNSIPFFEANGGFTETAGDFYHNFDDAITRSTGQLLCYNIETQSWWHWADCSDFASTSNSVISILPCVYFDRVDSNNFFSQMILKAGPNPSTLSQNIFYIDATASNYVDLPATTLYHPKYSVLCYFQTNTLDQSTIKNKLIRRVSVVCDPPLYDPTYIIPYGVDQYMYMAVMPNDMYGSLYGFFADPQTYPKIYPIRMQNLNPNITGWSTADLFAFNGPTPVFGRQLTIEGWFQANASGNGLGIPIWRWGAGNADSSFYMIFDQVSATVRNVGINIANSLSEVPGLHTAAYTQIISGTGLHHYAFVFDGLLTGTDKAKLYIDGVLTNWVSNNVTASIIPSGIRPIQIGYQAVNPASTYSGIEMSNARIWSTARTQDQIRYYMKTLYLNAVEQAGLVWSLLDGTERNIYDAQAPANQPVHYVQLPVNPPLPMFNHPFVNNLGMVQRASYAVLQKGPYSFRAKALEFDMLQGSRS